MSNPQKAEHVPYARLLRDALKIVEDDRLVSESQGAGHIYDVLQFQSSVKKRYPTFFQAMADNPDAFEQILSEI